MTGPSRKLPKAGRDPDQEELRNEIVSREAAANQIRRMRKKEAIGQPTGLAWAWPSMPWPGHAEL